MSSSKKTKSEQPKQTPVIEEESTVEETEAAAKTIVAHSLVRAPHGWQLIRLNIPEAEFDQYVEKRSPANILGIQLSKLNDYYAAIGRGIKPR